jgi:predicted enzyme related to lactoylglutathione lyase
MAPFEGSPEPYDMFTAATGPIGGVVQLPDKAASQGVPPHWLAYFGTPDVDATLARATELGATVVAPAMSMPGVGRFATIMDPWGAVCSLFTPEDPGPAPTERAGPGQISWHELMTEDYQKAASFYHEILGWEATTAMDMGPAGTYQLFKRSGADGDMGGMMNRPPEMPASAWMYYINVADLDAAAARVAEGGGQVMHGPMEVPGGDRVCVCSDPQGGWFALHSYGANPGIG